MEENTWRNNQHNVSKFAKKEQAAARKEEKSFSKPKKEDKDVKRTTINSQELLDLKKKTEEARSYMPVYTDDELESLDYDEEETDNYYDNVDYDEYDKYYDED